MEGGGSSIDMEVISLFKKPQTKAPAVLWTQEPERGRRSKVGAGKYWTLSHKGEKSLRFSPSSPGQRSFAEAPEHLYPRSWIKRPRNGGTWARNTNTYKRMASHGSLRAWLQLPLETATHWLYTVWCGEGSFSLGGLSAKAFKMVGLEKA